MNFESFFMAGFECATGWNAHQQWIDQIAATQHDRFLDEDYQMLREVGIRTLREGVRWPVIDDGVLDLSSVEEIVDTANRYRMELILDLFHYGFPDDLDIFSEEFCDRFEAYCGAVARVVDRRADVPIHFTPVNEPSYFAWAAGEAARFAPYLTGRAYELKVALCRAAIRAIDAIRGELPEARIINVDPICRVVAPSPELESEADRFNQGAVFESLDMISGRLHPELGGSLRRLDVIGINYYWTNQWELGRAEEPLSMDDPRLTSVGDLIRDVWRRYGRPMIISETSHVEHMRGPWLRYIVEEVEAVRAEGIPLQGICLYPVLGMPEWHEPEVWVRMGLWDCVRDGRGALRRVPHGPVFDEFRDARRHFFETEQARAAMRRFRP